MPGNQRVNVAGIVLAGTPHWGDSTFSRLLRGPMLLVAQEPLIAYPLRWLNDAGVAQTIICANSSTNDVRSSLGNGAQLGMSLTYHEDEMPRGAAGCVRDAGIHSPHDTFVVIECGRIPSVDLSALLDAHRESGAIATVVVETERRQSEVVGERPATPGGIYVFSRRVFDAIPALGFQDIKESLLERLYRAGDLVATYEIDGVAPRVISYETFVSVNAWLLTRMTTAIEVPDGYDRIGEGLRHNASFVDARARIVGPVLIGAGARVNADAVIVGPTIVGARTVVERNAMLARSILWNDCVVGEGAMVDQCLLTNGASAHPGERLVGAIHMRTTQGLRSIHPVPLLDPPRSMTEPFFALPSISTLRQ